MIVINYEQAMKGKDRAVGTSSYEYKIHLDRGKPQKSSLRIDGNQAEI
jgi:hypothetical protein